MTGMITTVVVAVFADLPERVREKRQRERLSLRSAADQIGVSFATVKRCECGNNLWLSHAIRLLRWVESSGGEA